MQKSKLKSQNQRSKFSRYSIKTLAGSRPLQNSLAGKIFYFLVSVFTFYSLLFTLSGCATAPYAPKPAPQIGIPGIYHRAQKGETLWRISKIYGIDLDEIASINHIRDATSIEIGQLIFIPRAQKKHYATYSTSDDFIWPLEGRVIAAFGLTSNNMVNKGINIQPYSLNDVVAARSGKVVFCADNFQGYGKTIIIDHGDGFSTVYARNSQLFIRPGVKVLRGGLIAKAGTAGKNKNIYLHFEIRKGNIAQNPYFYLSR